MKRAGLFLAAMAGIPMSALAMQTQPATTEVGTERLVATMTAVQELLGHSSIVMTMRYAHLAPEARESAVQQLDRPAPQLHAAPASDTGGAH